MSVSKTTLKTYFQTGDVPTESQFASLVDDVARSSFRGSYPAGSVIVQVGDSNTDNAAGRPDWAAALNYEWFSLGGIFYGCTDVNLGNNGSAISDWVSSIGTPTALTNVRGNANSVVNNDPDLIIVSLGTNELWSAARRAGIGVEATMQSNFDTLIQFFLDNTDADIWLRMPAPFGQPNTFGDWATADDAAASSEQLRRVHLAWKRKDPRVRLWDSHAALWGYRCDDITAAPLDSETGGQMFDDDLHRKALGYRREAQAMAEDLLGVSLQPTAVFRETPAAALTDSLWSETVYLNAIENSGTTLNILLDPIQLVNGLEAKRDQTCSISSRVLAQSHDSLRVLGKLGAASKLYSAGGASGVLKCFCHNSGNTYSMTTLTLNQRVTATAGAYYDQATPSNLVGGPFVSDDLGPVTFWVEDWAYAPRNTRNSFSYSFDLYPDKHVGPSDTAITNGYLWAFRMPFALTSVQLTSSFAQTPPSGGISNFHLIRAAGGYGGTETYHTPIGFEFADGSRTGSGQVDPLNYAAGDVLYVSCTSNGGSGKGFQFSFKGTKALW